jgi:hypothetical protein
MKNKSTFIACFYNGNFYSREVQYHDTTIYSDIELAEFSSPKKCNAFLDVAEIIYIDTQIKEQDYDAILQTTASLLEDS